MSSSAARLSSNAHQSGWSAWAEASDTDRPGQAFPVAITVEAHRVSGGLGSLVCEVIAENRLRCQAVRVGVSGPPTAVTGSEAYLLRRHGLDRDSLTTTALNVLAGTYA